MGNVAQLDALVRHAVVGNLHAADQQHHAAVADDRVAPADPPAGAIERRLDALVVLRPEHAVGDVFLARPNELDRTADGAGDLRGLDGVVGERAAAEGPTHAAKALRW
jgi:hypothetical protein